MSTAIKRARFACLFLAAACTGAAAQPVKTMQVDCARGETVAKALGQGDERKPLVLVVRGVCQESVRIERDDVTLRGDAAGGGLNGPDPMVDTLTVAASRVTIEAMTLGGGRNGVTASGAAGLTIRQSTVKSSGRTGILYSSGSSGLIDGCEVLSNPRDGIAVESASVTVTNSKVSQNSASGVFVAQGGTARIGIDAQLNRAGNAISQNGGNGISIVDGGQALIVSNQITGNGTDSASAGRGGIAIVQGTADIAGGNEISGNAGQGVFLRSATASIGNPTFGFSSANTISGNGSAASPGGVFAFLGSSVVIRDATITGNNGSGVFLSLRSSAQILNTTIQGSVPAGPLHLGDGIKLQFGSSLFATAPASNVSANAGFGLRCTDAESSWFGVPGALPTTVDPGCTGF